MSLNKKGFFLTFEGGEGSGKSTQAALLYEKIRRDREDVYLFREPGSTAAGEKIRELLLQKGSEAPAAETELLLFYAARAQLMHEKIKPLLGQGAFIICDRFKESTMAYQHYARGMSKDFIEACNRFTVGDTLPDLTIFLSVSPANAAKRLAARKDLNRLDSESIEFHKRVNAGYESIYKLMAEASMKKDKAEKTTEVLRYSSDEKNAEELAAEIFSDLKGLIN